MLNGRTLRFRSYIGNILVSKASIELIELIFGGVLAPKRRFSQKGRRNIFSRNPPYNTKNLLIGQILIDNLGQ